MTAQASANASAAPTLLTLARQYLEQLRARHYSARTIEGYGYMLNAFVTWCNERDLVHAPDVQRTHLARYQRHLYRFRKSDGAPLSLSHQLVTLVAVRGLFKWLLRESYILYDPAAELELPRKSVSLPHGVLTAQEVERLLMQADTSTPRGLRDRAIMETLYSTGIRCAELTNLKLYDLDSKAGTLFVRHGKGAKDRMVPIGERALAWLSRYIDEVRPRYVKESDAGFIFVSVNDGAGLSRGQTSHLVREYVVAAGLDKKGACHLFRHTMATLMLEHGADIRYIQAMLGHAKLVSTQVYTQVAIGKLKEVHTATHPGALLRRPQKPENGDVQ